MNIWNTYKFKTSVKRSVLAIGFYRPARYLNDLVFRRNFQANFRHDIEFYRTILPSRSLCFGVGANIGEKTEAMLRAGMNVIALEPQTLCVAEIKARCKRYSNVTILGTAVGACIGNAELYVSDSYHASSSLKKEWTESSSSIVVPITTLDFLVEQYGKPYYCKIDVEGFEMEVLLGLSRPIPIISLEYHLNEREIAKTAECVKHISRLANGRIGLNITPAEVNTFAFNNWLSEGEFWEKFPNELIARNEFVYGDIWVRSESAW